MGKSSYSVWFELTAGLREKMNSSALSRSLTQYYVQSILTKTLGYARTIPDCEPCSRYPSMQSTFIISVQVTVPASPWPC